MRSFVSWRSVLAVGLAAIGTARAGTINTPPITVGSGEGVGCVTANTGNKVIGPITFTVFRRNATVANTVTASSLEPNGSVGLAVSSAQLGIFQDIAYCRVEGKGISRSKTPVTLCALPAGSTTCLAAVISR